MHDFSPSSKVLFALTALGGVTLVSSATPVNQDNQAGYVQLLQLLSEEITILDGVTDANSAASALSPLVDNAAKLAALSTIVPDAQAFSLYILRSDERKMKSNHVLLALSAQKMRLLKAECFGCEAMSALLKNQH